ncbi:MAG: MBL fold metallo-hydrolase [Actinobacteria bacterium]|nr:MBL fold metallo-hydrolase [Actinomycetota bacterium]MBU1945296.1 MBL fold metallo-hydrolase [Actinomycetota bacterium]MBU2686496.1 MBL fold metallo-hydrolase [Actinomycetota bacterium]
MTERFRTYQPERAMWPAPANSYLLRDDRGAVLIDAGCGYRECYEKIVEFLAHEGLEPSDVHTLVLSHAHPDHMGAVPFLLEEASPRIIMHELEVPLAREPSLLNKSFDMDFIPRFYSGRIPEDAPSEFDLLDYFAALCPMGVAEATETVVGGDTLELAGIHFQVVHTPGHAPGHISLYNPADGTLLTGDLVGAVVAWYCPSGGGVHGYLESLDRLEELDVSLILPSHGPPIDDPAAAIRETREFLSARNGALTEELRNGERSLLELTDLLFPSEGMKMFPGLQVTFSHLELLEERGLVVCNIRDGMPYYVLEVTC